MTVSATRYFESILDRYAEGLLEETADRAARFRRPTKKTEKSGTASERLTAALANRKNVDKLIADLNEPELLTLAVFHRLPELHLRWDHAMRLLTALAVHSPYRAVQSLLAEGLLVMEPASRVDPLPRFEVADGLPVRGLPRVTLAAPLSEHALELRLPLTTLVGQTTTGRWRSADGWEFPLRMGMLWRMAWRIPIRKTQQDVLFKRDQDRISNGPLLNSPMMDEPVPLVETGMLTYALAAEEGWLDRSEDEQSPTATLEAIWAKDLQEYMITLGRCAVGVDLWNELGAEKPVGPFAEETTSARALLLLWLATLAPEEGVTTDTLAEQLEQIHPPWNAVGEVIGPMRHEETRRRLVREWTKRAILGPLYQSGLIEIATGEETLVRLSPIGRRFMGEQAEVAPIATFPHTLLVQPNHEVVVYRQGLTLPLLRQMLLLGEPKSLGAALTFEINADSVYHALEAGMEPDEMIEVLMTHSGHPPPPSVLESIRTWARKRSRLTVYASASLFEFADPKDMQDVLDRGIQGTPITERILLLASDQEVASKNIRITASRDYQQAVDRCVETGPDGIIFRVDLSRSDLMLESELRRFSDMIPVKDRLGRQQFRVTTDSLSRAIEQGLTIPWLEEWCQQRTGEAAPPAMQLLFRAAEGLTAETARPIVLRFGDPTLIEGVMQHPLTAELVGQRLGPDCVEVRPEKYDELRTTLESLGINLNATFAEVDS